AVVAAAVVAATVVAAAVVAAAVDTSRSRLAREIAAAAGRDHDDRLAVGSALLTGAGRVADRRGDRAIAGGGEDVTGDRAARAGPIRFLVVFRAAVAAALRDRFRLGGRPVEIQGGGVGSPAVRVATNRGSVSREPASRDPVSREPASRGSAGRGVTHRAERRIRGVG